MKHRIKKFLQEEKLLIIAMLLSYLLIFTLSMSLRNDCRTKEKSTEIIVPQTNEIFKILRFGYANISEDEALIYSEMFLKYSEKYKIDWKIYPALITIESNWDPTAISPDNAKGLMQILEPTFKGYCAKLKIPYQENKTIWNVILNLQVGLEYISQSVKSRGLEKGVKSYIGGAKYSEAHPEVKEYWIKFKGEYAKVRQLNQEFDRLKSIDLIK